MDKSVHGCGISILFYLVFPHVNHLTLMETTSYLDLKSSSSSSFLTHIHLEWKGPHPTGLLYLGSLVLILKLTIGQKSVNVHPIMNCKT